MSTYGQTVYLQFSLLIMNIQVWGQKWFVSLKLTPFISGRVAHTLLTKILDEFASKVSSDQWPNGTEQSISFTQLPAYVSKYQDPREADPLTKMQEDLDETKIILRNTIEQVLVRGEKLDDLVSQSEELSVQSKAFYKTAKKTNSCCNFS